MPQTAEVEKLALIAQVAALASDPAGPPERFIAEFYKNVPPDDIIRRAAPELYAAAASLWGFMAERRPGKAKLRVLVPTESERSGTGSRTLVQIVNDDMAFLVDSVTAALNRLELVVHLVIHPVIPVERDTAGALLKLGSAGDLGESLMHIELGGLIDATKLQLIEHDLDHVLADVRAAVVDWGVIRKKVERVADDLGSAALPVSPSEAAEVSAFLYWLIENNFTFLGYREYSFGDDGLQVVPGVGRGLLRNDAYLVFDGLRNFSALSPDVQEFLRSPQLMLISKSNRRSTVHRAVQMDTIGIKTFNEAGDVVGQILIVGLFTSASYSQPPRSIPVLRRKVQRCIERSGYAHESHDGKALQHILDAFPRDELFQISEEDLIHTARGILHLQERQRIALFARRDPFERFVSALVYVPRERYNPDVRRRMAAILERAFNGTIASETAQVDESVLARLHFIIDTVPGQVPELEVAEVEAQLVEAGRIWSDRLAEALSAVHGEDGGLTKLRRFGDAFPALYAERFSAADAVADLARIEQVEAGTPIALTLYHPASSGPADLSLKIFHLGTPVALSDVLPMLENLGLKVINEIPFEIRPLAVQKSIWIQEFQLQLRSSVSLALGDAGPRFEEAFPAVWGGELENDGFNRLILLAGLTARETVVLRTYCKVLRQAGSLFSQAYMENTLGAHPEIAYRLVKLFVAQFDPAADAETRPAEIARLTQEIEAALDHVTNLDEDRILRSFLLLIAKTLRTNYYQRDGRGWPKPYLSVKLASQEIDLLPAPRPLVEVFVYSPRMEGCHLRGGRVARGGIRWSDRREDFRTEILGLMKAQMVKNSVIVPVGSKGGFVVKRSPATGGREALMAEVVTCYKTLMAGLLDLTDTIEGDAIVPPKNVVRRDQDDPYLVVAADKGTATFSDIANGVALDYGFWLGDAFASGGSVGYDHKAMGITARGAWEAVKRHFREIGTDIQSTDFTCIGIGDMAGDVFGNGMLLSKHTRLIAAFNHLHIFIDPNPDSATSWVERKRLFDLPRSSWADYDRTLLSPGGAIYERAAKSIALSPEAKAALGLEQDSLSPNQLINALLRQPVDLLWFGGIGTYVKATSESQAEAGDRANDALRVNGAEIRAKVIGEGANLAMTQRARIEYALRGGRLNTDAIDNSAGVDTSDHEVNIKIAVGAMMQSGAVKPADRAQFLAAMTDEVGELVLEDNYLQTQALTMAEAEAVQVLDQHVRLIRTLERAGKLDRAIEYLPDDDTLAQRVTAKQGLTRPELAVLLAYAKNAVYAELLGTNLPDDPELEAELLGYFPRQMVVAATPDLKAHRLRREIIATHITNAMINRMGPSFVNETHIKTGRVTADIARAYRITRDVLDLPSVWRAIEALDNQIPAGAQTALLLEAKTVAERACRWFLQSGRSLDIALRIREFAPGLKLLAAQLPALLPPGEKQSFATRQARFVEAGVPAPLAARAVSLVYLATGLDIVRIDQATDVDVIDMGKLYYETGERLGLDSLRDVARGLPATTQWQRLAVAAMLDDFYALQSEVVQRVLSESGSDGSVDQWLGTWLSKRQESLTRLQEMVSEISRGPAPDLSMLTVVGRQLRALANA